MSSLASLVAADGRMRLGSRGVDVRLLQIALSQAGYRVTIDAEDLFTEDTDYWIRQFQRQHGLSNDGVVGALTAAMLDAPHTVLVNNAQPLVVGVGVDVWPHDDTASLSAFYGDPTRGLDAWKAANVTTVQCPWPLLYAGQPWPHPIQFHKRAAAGLTAALEDIWHAAGRDASSPVLRHVRNFAGSGELRAVRGSSRISTHGFWAAIDFDADALPMTHNAVNPAEMPQEVVDAFLAAGAYWGGNYRSRKDPMHFQFAHE